ncbi:MAG TPA: 4'-phosphopantetheinyl transferase superfamily protein [Solirubrobacteraceae bacterium]
MSEEQVILVACGADEAPPQVRLIDACTVGLSDEASLRERARETSAHTGARFTSRSYSFPFALVAWHSSAVGVDIERVEPCDEAFGESIRTPTERAAGAPEEDRDRFFTSLWSSKEALSKALGDPLGYDPRHLQGPGTWPDGRSGPWRAATLEVGAEHVAWLCWWAAA